MNFDENSKHITAMNSLQGEKVVLVNPVKITLEVEEWMSNLSNEMKNTLKKSLSQCLRDIMISKCKNLFLKEWKRQKKVFYLNIKLKFQNWFSEFFIGKFLEATVCFLYGKKDPNCNLNLH